MTSRRDPFKSDQTSFPFLDLGTFVRTSNPSSILTEADTELRRLDEENPAKSAYQRGNEDWAFLASQIVGQEKLS